MRKQEAVTSVVHAFPSTPIVFSTGYISRMAYVVRDTSNHFYMVGSMGLAASIGAGIAVTAERLVVVVDGDGSFLMGLNGILLADDLGSARIVHVVLDDGEYDSTGGQPAPPSTRRISEFARAAGYAAVYEPEDVASLELALLTVSEPVIGGSVMVHCRVEPAHAAPPRIDIELPDIFARLRQYLTHETVVW